MDNITNIFTVFCNDVIDVEYQALPFLTKQEAISITQLEKFGSPRFLCEYLLILAKGDDVKIKQATNDYSACETTKLRNIMNKWKEPFKIVDVETDCFIYYDVERHLRLIIRITLSN